MAARKAKSAGADASEFVRVKMPLTLRGNVKLSPGVYEVSEDGPVTPKIAERILAVPKWAAIYSPEKAKAPAAPDAD